jgi:hypothetical protein
MKFPSAILFPLLCLLFAFPVSAENTSQDQLASWEDHLSMAGATGTEMYGEHVLMKDSSAVKVGTFEYDDGLDVDVFYPPGMDFEKDYPVLTLLGLSDIANRRESGKPYRYTHQALGWGQWAAENGFVVLIPETGSDPKTNQKTLIQWARTEGRPLGIDGNRVGYFSSSDACDAVLKNLRPETRGIPAPSALFAVFYYGNLVAFSGQDTNVPYFVVAVEDDAWADIDRIAAFVDKMRDRGAEVVYEIHESGSHGFELIPDNGRTMEILDATMKFMIAHSGL